MDVFIGIDVACAKDKYLPLVICTRQNGQLLPFPLANYQIKPPRGLGNALTLSLQPVLFSSTKTKTKSVCRLPFFTGEN